MLLRMKRILATAWLLLGIASGCAAQEPCSQSARAASAAAAAIRQQLRAVKPATDMDTNIPAAAQTLIPQLKAALVQAAKGTMACHDATIDPKALENEIATTLNANPPQPPPNSVVMNGDPRYPEWLSEEYGSNLLVSVARPQPQLLSIQFQFHIECGNDTVWIAFEQQGGKWQQKLLWQAQAYTEISGAFGDFFLAGILIPNSAHPEDWRAVAAHGNPWCTSRFSKFSVAVLAPAANGQARVVWQTDREYSRGDFAPILRSTANTFELRLHDDEMRFDPENAFERLVIYRYQVAGDNVTRVEPIAANGRGFVEEWLSMPWGEAAGQTAPEAVAGLRTIHEHIADLDKNPDTYVRVTSGPVRSCLTKRHYEVEMEADPGGPGFYAIAEVPNGYMMMSYGTTHDERCNGPDLMKKP